MSRKKKRIKRVTNVFSVLTPPADKDDERGHKLLAESKRRIERSGYKLVKAAVVEDEFGRSQAVHSGKTPAGNLLIIGEKPI